MMATSRRPRGSPSPSSAVSAGRVGPTGPRRRLGGLARCAHAPLPRRCAAPCGSGGLSALPSSPKRAPAPGSRPKIRLQLLRRALGVDTATPTVPHSHAPTGALHLNGRPATRSFPARRAWAPAGVPNVLGNEAFCETTTPSPVVRHVVKHQVRDNSAVCTSNRRSGTATRRMHTKGTNKDKV